MIGVDLCNEGFLRIPYKSGLVSALVDGRLVLPGASAAYNSVLMTRVWTRTGARRK